MNTPAYICDAIRTPFGRYGGILSSIRADDLGAIPLMALMVRNPGLDWEQVSDVLFGCANQAGEDSRNVARMASLLAGIPDGVSGATINRLCASGLDAVGSAARAIKSGEAMLMIAGGVESMSRAPFVISKAETAFARNVQMCDTTNGQRFVNKLMQAQYGQHSMPETAENAAREFGLDRESQDSFAYASYTKASAAQKKGHFDAELTPVAIAQKNGDPTIVTKDELREHISPDLLDEFEPLVDSDGTVTAGNSAGLGDGACALLLACEKTAHKYNLMPKARVLGMATAGVPPRLMGIGSAPAARKVLVQTGLTMEQIEVIELHESCAAHSMAALRDWGLRNDDARVNPNGGAIALGHPLGASGARMVMTAMHQLHRIKGRYALCAMCVDAGQGIAMIIERV